MSYSVRTRLRQLLEDPRAVAVLERHLPGASSHPQLHLALDMSLQEIASYPEAGLTPDKLKAIVEELERL
jgi:hypothetical protein